jgi:hypothetical protein
VLTLYDSTRQITGRIMTLRSIFRTAGLIPLLGAAVWNGREQQNKFLDSIRLGNHSWRIDLYWGLAYHGMTSLNFYITMSAFVTKFPFIRTEWCKSHLTFEVWKQKGCVKWLLHLAVYSLFCTWYDKLQG